MSTETGPQADRRLITLRERMIRVLLAPRYGGPQHNTPGGLPLTATPEEARRHRAGQTVDRMLSALPAELARHVTRAIFALKSPPPAGSEHYRSGWDDGVEAAMDAARDAVLAVVAPGSAPAAPSEAVRKRLRRWAYAAGHIESELDGAVDRIYELVARDVLSRTAPEPPAAPTICELPHETIEEEDECERRRLAAAPDPLATECANPECEHTLNWRTGTPGGVCVARGASCPCDAFVPPAGEAKP